MRTCPVCEYEGTDFLVKYTQPLRYECPNCNAHHVDPNDGSQIKVLSAKEGMEKRPEMYSEEDRKRIHEALKGLCPSCGGNPDVDCSCNPWR